MKAVHYQRLADGTRELIEHEAPELELEPFTVGLAEAITAVESALREVRP